MVRPEIDVVPYLADLGKLREGPRPRAAGGDFLFGTSLRVFELFALKKDDIAGRCVPPVLSYKIWSLAALWEALRPLFSLHTHLVCTSYDALPPVASPLALSRTQLASLPRSHTVSCRES